MRSLRFSFTGQRECLRGIDDLQPHTSPVQSWHLRHLAAPLRERPRPGVTRDAGLFLCPNITDACAASVRQFGRKCQWGRTSRWSPYVHWQREPQ